MMAIAGGATVAYRFRVVGGTLATVGQLTRLRAGCATVDHALDVLAEGEAVVVAGCDAAALRREFARRGAVVVDDGPASLNEVVNEHYPEDWD